MTIGHAPGRSSDVDLTTEVVRTDRLLLRPPRPDDEDAVFRACQDPEILRWTALAPDALHARRRRAWVREIAPGGAAEGRGLPCVVEAGGELVGSAGLAFLATAGWVEVGYWTAPWARRRGYAAEATLALAGWAFGHGAARVHLLGGRGQRRVAGGGPAGRLPARRRAARGPAEARRHAARRRRLRAAPPEPEGSGAGDLRRCPPTGSGGGGCRPRGGRRPRARRRRSGRRSTSRMRP